VVVIDIINAHFGYPILPYGQIRETAQRKRSIWPLSLQGLFYRRINNESRDAQAAINSLSLTTA